MGRQKNASASCMNAVISPSGISVMALGRNGVGKIDASKNCNLGGRGAGSADPTVPAIVLTKGRISFPVGFAGSFIPT